jgi:uncharacterized protein (TIGR03086 family)
MEMIPDYRAQDAVAVRATIALVDQIRPEDLDRPTPCAQWDLRALLAHMTVQHLGFAASATGQGGEDLETWRVRPLTADYRAEYAEAAERAIAAFAEPDVLERTFPLPEIGPTVAVPGRQAISFHFIDYVVHGWDVARALDRLFELPADLVAAAVPVAEAVPDGERRRRPNASFAPRLTSPEDGDTWTRILTLLGRSPQWKP